MTWNEYEPRPSQLDLLHARKLHIFLPKTTDKVTMFQNTWNYSQYLDALTESDISVPDLSLKDT